MSKKRQLPCRESVFIQSLRYHGFCTTRRRKNLKYRLGYIIPATRREDASGIDLWVKMPKDDRLLPVQVTQRGIRMFRKYHSPSNRELENFISTSNKRVDTKRSRCFKQGVAFALVRDFDGELTNPIIAWGDIKALRFAIAHLRRWL